MTDEVAVKYDRLREVMTRRGLDGLILGTLANYAWLSGGGDSHVSFASDRGVAALLVDETGIHLITSNIEADRMLQEQLPGLTPASVRVFNWFDTNLPAYLAGLAEETAAKGRKLGADFLAPGFSDVAGDILACHRPFHSQEVARLRALAADISAIFEGVASRVKPGLTEWEIASMLTQEATARGAQVPGVLIGADDRVYHRRHPLMVGARVERYALMGLVIQRGGLHAALSRSIHFGPVPAELSRRQQAVTLVCAALVGSSRPGVRLCEALQAAVAAYADAGYPDEWQRHHQGGVIGYLPREYVATPASDIEIVAWQSQAWNPTVAGTKSEETVLVTPGGPEILTSTPSWPVLEHSVNGQTYRLSGILRG